MGIDRDVASGLDLAFSSGIDIFKQIILYETEVTLALVDTSISTNADKSADHLDDSSRVPIVVSSPNLKHGVYGSRLSKG